MQKPTNHDAKKGKKETSLNKKKQRKRKRKVQQTVTKKGRADILDIAYWIGGKKGER